MRVVLFSAKPYDREAFEAANRAKGHDIEMLDARLDERTAVLARGAGAVCVFVNDIVDAATIAVLRDCGVRAIALRCAGFNNVDVDAARAAGVAVVRVPAYAPDAVAEHTLAMILCLDRHLHRAFQRVRDGNFSLVGLLGEGLHGRDAGVVGTGQIGRRVALLLSAFGCVVRAFDPHADDRLVAAGVRYCTLEELLAASDILALTCPLTPATYHMIDDRAVAQMRPGLMLVNTGRGALIDTAAVIEGLKSGRIGSLALDVYEEEGPLFFEDRSMEVLTDDAFARLTTFPNVLLTAHQGFFTRPALAAIAETTLANLDAVEAGATLVNAV